MATENDDHAQLRWWRSRCRHGLRPKGCDEKDRDKSDRAHGEPFEKRRAFSIVTQLDDMKMKRRGSARATRSNLELDLLQGAFGRHDVMSRRSSDGSIPKAKPSSCGR